MGVSGQKEKNLARVINVSTCLFYMHRLVLGYITEEPMMVHRTKYLVVKDRETYRFLGVTQVLFSPIYYGLP